MTNHLEVADLMAENARLLDLVAKREDLCGKLVAEAQRDIELKKQFYDEAHTLRAALTQFVAACETAPPTSLMIELGMACKVAKEALTLSDSSQLHDTQGE